MSLYCLYKKTDEDEVYAYNFIPELLKQNINNAKEKTGILFLNKGCTINFNCMITPIMRDFSIKYEEVTKENFNKHKKRIASIKKKIEKIKNEKFLYSAIEMVSYFANEYLDYIKKMEEEC